MIRHPTDRAERRRLADIKDKPERSRRKHTIAELRDRESADELKESVPE